MKHTLGFLWLGLAWLAFLFIDGKAAGAQRPNVVLIFCDNLGYGDVGCFGSHWIRTPHLDRMAEEGTRFTHFYVASGVCTPSRASLMTGSYPRRVGLHRTDPDGAVLRPVSPNGLNPEEITMAEYLRRAGYATAIIGKWHLGDQDPFLPTRQGFDEFFGIPYSDDMTARAGKDWPALPLMRQEKVVEAPVNRNLLTRRYTEEALRFMEKHQDHPFFLYLPHAMPGSTANPYASDDFRGRSQHGNWGDCVEEIDWSTGEILAGLKRLGLDEKTLVIWTSDNGAPRRQPMQGSNLPLGGWGYSTMEGGMRVPCIVRWPGVVPAKRVSNSLLSTLDILPTLAELAGVSLDASHPIDGFSFVPLLTGASGAVSPRQHFAYYHMDQLQAVRQGKWKLHLPLPNRRINLRGDERKGEAVLIDVETDPGETRNLAVEHPDVVAEILGLAEGYRAILGDGDLSGSGQRPVGRFEQPIPLVP